MKSLKDAVSKRDIQSIRNKMDELRKTAQEIGAVIYQQSQPESKESQKT
jgi:hypothetical protein